MPTIRTFICFALLGAFGSGDVSWGQTAEQTVEQFFPEQRLPVENQSDKRSCFAVVSSDSGGAPLSIVAAYSNLARGVVRLLVRSGGMFMVASESSPSLEIIGSECTVALAPLSAASATEAVVVYDEAQGWVFQINNGLVINLTPTSAVGRKDFTRLFNPDLCDLKHDGTKQICTSPGNADVPKDRQWEQVYVLSNGSLQIESYLLAIRTINADWHAAAKRAVFADVIGSVGPYTVRFVNGDAFGRHRLTTGSIALNGVEVIGPSILNDQFEFGQATFSGSLSSLNELEIDANGPANSTVTVMVSDSTVH
jgi:hypothetical protein